jgi:phenylalanyl-tRNA synthetase beta chain
MKVSLAWIKELLAEGPATTAIDAAAAARALTMVGLEVESVEERGRELAGVLIAEVLAIRPHPSADKLRLVRVRAGTREEEVVCGAPNVPPAGNRVVWAAPGARLPGGKAIEPREVRGVLSPGMLCSEPELGIGDKGEGILILEPDAPSGADFAATYGVQDDILEVNVTPNRPDALSHLGIARELGAALGLALRLPAALPVKRSASVPRRDVSIVEDAGCPRYLAGFVTDLTVRPSPLAMRLRLAACGVRPISNLVDVTNHVLLELGHPLHAFDLDKVEGAVRVRRAQAGERLVTLDGIDRTLLPGDIVIADDRGALALAGVMGGARSEVTATTRTVLLEAATFDEVSVRRTSKRLGLSSEASYRFERGVDAEGIPRAARRATDLLAQLGGGVVAESFVDRYPLAAVRRKVSLPMARLARISGLPIDVDSAARELAKVSDGVEVQGAGDAVVITVTVPTHRPDLRVPEDLVEEVLRLGGRYEAPAQIERVLSNARPAVSPEAASDRARDALAAAGLSEICSWGFVARSALAALGAGSEVPTELVRGIEVKNPISADYEVMRTSLLPGLAGALGRNLSRGVEDARLFEVGPVIRRASASAGAAAEGEPQQREQAAVLMAGRAGGWMRPGEPLDFFDLKRAIEAAVRRFGAAIEFVAPVSSKGGEARDGGFLHPGIVAALVTPAGQKLGWAGELDPRVARALGIEVRALYAELDVALLDGARTSVHGAAPPRFPAATRDLSFWVDASVPAAEQRAAFRGAGEALLVDVAVREDFRDPKYAPPGKKGMLWSMTYRAEDRTLTEGEADAAHGRVVAALGAKLPIQIR